MHPARRYPQAAVFSKMCCHRREDLHSTHPSTYRVRCRCEERVHDRRLKRSRLLVQQLHVSPFEKLRHRKWSQREREKCVKLLIEEPHKTRQTHTKKTSHPSLQSKLKKRWGQGTEGLRSKMRTALQSSIYCPYVPLHLRQFQCKRVHWKSGKIKKASHHLCVRVGWGGMGWCWTGITGERIRGDTGQEKRGRGRGNKSK